MFDVVGQLSNNSSAYAFWPVALSRQIQSRIPDVPDNTSDDYVREFLVSALEDSRRWLFDQWASEWLEDTQWQSSMSIITGHPRFADIKSLGNSSIKFILERMKEGDVQVHWFPVLYDLSGGQNPVPCNQRGVIPEMTKAWIEWGEDAGLI